MIDIAVIGGGVNGLAIAREAACRGLTVTLLERTDICDGATRASSHMIHGGLKYLERLDLGLVRESIRERHLLLRNAPHLVREYPMLIPFFRGGRRPRALVRCGMLLHDLMSCSSARSRSKGMTTAEVVRAVPGILTAGLAGGGVFDDAQVMWPERLCVELMLDAVSLGAEILTHTKVTELIRDGGRVAGVRYRDQQTGGSGSLPARLTINATGPWIDQTLAGGLRVGRLSGGTKGSHLVLEPFDGAPRIGLFFEARQDGRPVFVLPWGDSYLLGSTDLTYSGDLDDVRIDDDEVAYLLREANQILPSAHLSIANVRSAYSGIRPLPFVGAVAENAGISRGHKILSHAPDHPGVLTIIGGKLTTHRALAEDAVNKAIGELGGLKQVSPTRDRRLPGADTEDWAAFAQRFLADAPLPRRHSDALLRVYGVRARRVVDLMSLPQVIQIAGVDDRVLAAEVVLAVREERAVTLADVLLRRLPHRLGSAAGQRKERFVAGIMAGLLSWDESRVDREIGEFRAELARTTALPSAAIAAREPT